MADEDSHEEAARRIHDTLQSCITDGLINGSMVLDWYLVGRAMTEDGDGTNAIYMAPESAVTATSLGLVNEARLVLENDFRRWIDEL